MAEIQRRVIKQSGRNTVSRLLHARNDKETIAAWKADLNQTLHIFNVCSVASAWSSLTERSQTELLMNTHVIVSDIRQDVVSTHAIVSNVHQGVVNTHSVVSELRRDVATTSTTVTDTHTIVSDIHRAIVVNHGGTDDKTPSVSVDCIPFAPESMLTVPRIELGRRSQSLADPVSYTCI